MTTGSTEFYILIQVREPHVGDFAKYDLNICLRSDAHEPNSFKLSMKRDTAKLFSLTDLPVLITFYLHSRIQKSPINLGNVMCSHFVVKQR